MKGVAYSVDIPGWDKKLIRGFSVAIKPGFYDWRLLVMKIMFLRLEKLGGSPIVNLTILKV